MRVRWRGLELPARVTCDTATLTPTYGCFTAEPFERGFGTTVGNSLRRILLSSLEGAAVAWISLEGVAHEFSSIEGVVEDITDIVLNVKGLVVRLQGDEPRKMRIEKNAKGEVTAADIRTDERVEILHGQHHIATLNVDRPFVMEMEVRKGRGYITAEESEGKESMIGRVPLDMVFSPVTRVRYRTEDTRVGQRTNYDRLILEIWTDGTVTPEMALVEAAKILRKHLNPFVQYFELGEKMAADAAQVAEEPALEMERAKKYEMNIEELDLSVRASNCLESAGIRTIGELVAKTGEELLEIRNFGKTSLTEVETKLAAMGLELKPGEEDEEKEEQDEEIDKDEAEAKG
ncbi:MAG: DNA-directed RNA polymerase subunit alpha [Planctomycetota bacterium]